MNNAEQGQKLIRQVDMPGPGAFANGFVKLIVSAHGRWLGALVLALCVALVLTTRTEHSFLRLKLFDLYQQVSPRDRDVAPVRIVEIDQKSLDEIGHWPWPRDKIAQILDNISDAGALATGVDVFFTDPDRLSPSRLADTLTDMPPKVAEMLGKLPDTDMLLAHALDRNRTVLAVAGLSDSDEQTERLRVPPVFMTREAKTDSLQQYQGYVQSRNMIRKQATSTGLINAVTEKDGVVRRIPMLAQVDGRAVPTLALEMWRLAAGQQAVTYQADRQGFHTAQIAHLNIPLQDDGTMFVPFGRSRPDIYISATDVLHGRIPDDFLKNRLALIGVSAIGLGDKALTPLFEKIPGVEVHAQVMEAIFTETYQIRPRWAFTAELVVLVVMSAMLIWIVPILPGSWVAAGATASAIALLSSGIVIHRELHLLLDAVTPLVVFTATGASMVLTAILINQARRRALEHDLQQQREARARIDGELAAATRIQLGLLPDHRDFANNDARFDLAAFLEPAREVGGDLYDFFMIDENRLFFAVGDVSGKGVGASLFMAISKALYKSAVLRGLDQIDEITIAANDEIARDNPEMLFVTLFAGILDLDTGLLTYCNAGHDQPQLFADNTSPDQIMTLEEGGGPPLCVMEGFPYMSATRRLEPGQTLVVTTDGVAEAMNREGALYGTDRLIKTLTAASTSQDRPAQIIERVYNDVKDHADGALASDDLTMIVVRWEGGRGQ